MWHKPRALVKICFSLEVRKMKVRAKYNPDFRTDVNCIFALYLLQVSRDIEDFVSGSRFKDVVKSECAHSSTSFYQLVYTQKNLLSMMVVSFSPSNDVLQ